MGLLATTDGDMRNKSFSPSPQNCVLPKLSTQAKHRQMAISSIIRGISKGKVATPAARRACGPTSRS